MDRESSATGVHPIKVTTGVGIAYIDIVVVAGGSEHLKVT